MHERRPIGSFAKVRRGASPRPIGDPKYFGDSAVGWVRISDVTQRSYKYLKNTEQYLSPLGESRSLRVNKGDLIMSICATVGKPIIVDMPACIHDGFVQVYDIAGVDTEYLFYLLQFHEKDFEKRGQPGTQVNLNTTIVENEIVFVPAELARQKKIAHILTTVDNLIEQTQALIDKYTAVKQGMMHDLFTRGIDLATGQLRPSYEQAPELYKETELGWVPREWGVLELKNVLDFLDGQRIPLKSEDRYFMQGPYPYYGASGIIDYVNSYIFDGDYILLGEDGENVVSRNVPLAFRVSGKIWVNNHAHVLKPKNGHSLDFYVEYLESLNYENIVSGSAQPKITQSQLARLFVISPDLHEQVKISEVISALEAKKQREVDSLGKLREQKKGLMQDLLTGRVRVDG
jgi:type I restriction enzyme S subunit